MLAPNIFNRSLFAVLIVFIFIFCSGFRIANRKVSSLAFGFRFFSFLNLEGGFQFGELPYVVNLNLISPDSGSWRQQMFQKIVTPEPKHKQYHRKRDYKVLWRKAIEHQRLLNRMEKENLRLNGK